VTGAAASAAVNSAEPVRFERVLAGVALAGAAAELAGRLDLAFLTEAGWDPVSRVLAPPAEHPLLGRTVCRVVGCTSTAHGGPTGGVCWRCFTRLRGQGLTGPLIASAPELPPLPDRPAGCAVPGCQRMSPTPRSTLCAKHSRRFRRRPGRSLDQFLTDPGVRPLPALGPCRVAACTRTAESEHGYCSTHYVRWRTAVVAEPDTDQRHWESTATAVSEGGQVSLRGLPPLVVIEVLFGVQQRVRGGAKVKDVIIRGVCDTLRRQRPPGSCSPRWPVTSAGR
jgi:hypothetical protein